LASPSISTPSITGQITASTSIIDVGSGQIYKDASGNVGVGTVSPSTKLHVASGNIRLDENQYILWGGNTNGINGNNASNLLSLYTNSTERLRIASSGQIGIGGANYGTSGQVLTSGGASAAPSWTTISSTPADGSITPAKLSQPFTRATAVATTSGTQIDFTGIPSWARMITVAFNAVSLNDAGDFLVRIGSSTISTTNYVSTSLNNGTGGADGANSTSGFVIRAGSSGDSFSGLMHIVNVSGNIWVSSHRLKRAVSNVIGGGGDATLSGVLDRVAITSTTAGTFDNGSINIIYQG